MVSTKYNIAIIGLGYVGLPTALELYKKGHSIIGIDTSETIVENLKNRKNHLSELAGNWVIPKISENWRISSNYGSEIANAEIILVTVPTPISDENQPDISFVESAIGNIMKLIKPNSRTILVLESTVYPGVTRSVVTKYALEEGKKPIADYLFAYCPERIDPGVKNRPLTSINRIVGCDDKETADILIEMYSMISGGATHVGSPEVAEAAKLIENVQRDVDIALTNELAVVLSQSGLDAEEVFSAAATKWNFHRHKPGIGVGGHCIAVDPYYYLSLFDEQDILSESLVNISRKTNNNMPVVSKSMIVKDLSLSPGDKVLVMGYSYKQNVGDNRNTPVLRLITELLQDSIECEIFDPLCDHSGLDVIWHTDDSTIGNDFSAIIVATPHEIFQFDHNYLENFCPNKKIFDGRRTLEKKAFLEQGWKFSAVGLAKL